MKRPGAGRRMPGTPEGNGAGGWDEPLKAFVHDVANPLAAIEFSVSALRSSKVLTERELADVRRTERALAQVGQMIDSLAAAPEVLMPRGSPADGTTDLYLICCELAARRRGGRRVIHCRAHGDPRGRWDRGQLVRIVSRMLDRTLAHLDGRSPMTITVTGMNRHVRLDVHALGSIGPRRRQACLDFPATVPDKLGGTLTAAVSAGASMLTLRLPR